MANIDLTYYNETFHGVPIPASEFDRLADIASDVIYEVCIVKPEAADLENDLYKKAVAYQVELLYKQGGIDAAVGFAESSYTGGSEHLGDYSISKGNARQDAVRTFNGIPVSALAIALLKRLGLMTRWAYAWRDRRGKT